MFAIIDFGGSQRRVKKDDVFQTNKVAYNVGDEFVIENVLSYGEGENLVVGKPTLKNVTVKAQVLEQKRDDKVIIIKKIRRHNYRRKNGHRQYISVLKILDIINQ